MSGSPALWQEVECGAYAADLELWEELAADASGPVLDLGCGVGRVASHLAGRGVEVVGVEADGELAAAADERLAGLPGRALRGDARRLSLDEEFSLALGPMQLVQLLGGQDGRLAMMRGVAAHLRPGGVLALAIVERLPEPATGPGPPPLPDAREVDGWVYSSLPLETVVAGGAILVRRLRQTVSPEGELSEETDEVALAELSAATLEREAAEAGLRPAGRRLIPATEEHVGSTVVLLAREA